MKRFALTGLAIGLMLLGTTADAQERCRQRDPELTAQIRQLIQDVQDGNRPDLTSVDKFLAAVPPQIRRSMIFVGDSRSLQESTPFEPRVLIKSPNSDVVISFNLNPDHMGYDAIEMTLWNGDTAKMEMVEIRFPEDTQNPSIRDGGTAQVEMNPMKCTVCHTDGETMRWHFDPYRFWAGHVPWTEDALNEGSIEVEWYKALLQKVEDGEPRMRHLLPFETVEDIDREVARTGRYQIKSTDSETTQPNNTPALDMSHQLLIYNGCRIGWQLYDRPDWDQIKYAVVAAVTTRCDDPTRFLSEEQNAGAAKYFTDIGVGLDDGEFSHEALQQDTRDRQWSLSKDREGRQLWFFEKYLGSLEAAMEEIQLAADALIRKDRNFRDEGMRFPTFENSQDEVYKSRYLLQPLGIEVDRWAMAVDPGTYSHVEFFDEIERSQPIRDVIAEVNAAPGGNFCAKLARMSREALGGRAMEDVELEDFCAPEVLEAAAQELAGTIEPAALRADAEDAFGVCSGCHAGRVLGAPAIPFHDLNDLADEIRKTDGSFYELGARIWDRVTRHPEIQGAMPKFGSPLSTEQKVSLRAWMDTLTND